MVETLKQTERLRNLSLFYTHAVIEAGHQYADSRFSPVGEKDLYLSKMGKEIAMEIRESFMLPSSLWWFIDELHCSPDGIDKSFIENLRDMNKKTGFNPEVTIFESNKNLQDEALSLIERIPEEHLLKYRKGVSLIRDGQSNYLLCQKDKNKNLYDPKCCLIDAALYVKKWDTTKREGVCITILPNVYEDQQDTTKLILERADFSIPIVNIYYTHSGVVAIERNF